MPRKKKATLRSLLKTVALCAVLSLIATFALAIAMKGEDEPLSVGNMVLFYAIFFGLFVVPTIAYGFIVGKFGETVRNGLKNSGFVQDSEAKTCPRCAESVKAAATVCRYCGHEFA